ncbi:type I glutamate--ammonia ligase [Candidatus Tokpelaia sp.]|uniref:type I glutamate--ammonia ligase n=1 Tax=Candidatus Tokpelaia sp. TaxID=2233777 RepID=UPI001238F1E4|nr:type I glutamate--ammonia ligase [Candidatus Tokpelaia sp.]KAA6405573.1 type I glutamate--ammonia ligase [Candidatus Tokpelaia sp.]
MLISAILEKIRAENIRFIDLRFTDLRGKWHHITIAAATVDKALFAEGVVFDASSIDGWRAVDDSDMVLRPDLEIVCLDPFFAEPTLVVFCNVVDPVSLLPYNRDPRTIAGRSQAYAREHGFGDTVYIGPEAEFFVFDTVRFQAGPYENFYYLDSDESPLNSGRDYAAGNMGHRPPAKGGYLPVPPVDSAQDMRSEMLAMLQDMGVVVEKHHHETAAAQHELGIKFDSLLRQADKMQIFKYAVRQVAQSYGKTASFMPKPVFGDSGSGMHVHLSLWKDGKPLFAGDKYAGLSEACLYFIGGIIKHARALNAFTNPATNSYKRLVPGFEAPVLLAYSARNRSAACRIPHVFSAMAKRVEVRFPDPAANPYLAFSALLMAGLDGIKHKIHPGEAIDKDLYELRPRELKNIPTVSADLREALAALDKDRAFLKAGNVFDDDMIESYIALKQQEVQRYETMPSPVEFAMYYSV